jgi:hypothetical protein
VAEEVGHDRPAGEAAALEFVQQWQPGARAARDSVDENEHVTVGYARCSGGLVFQEMHLVLVQGHISFVDGHRSPFGFRPN